MAKKKGGIAALIPVALSSMLLGGGAFWMIVGLIIGVQCKFDVSVITPVFWILGGSIFVVGLIFFIVVMLLNRRKGNE